MRQSLFAVWCACACVALGAVSFDVVHARGAALAPAQAPASLPDAPGKEVVEKVCTACHGLDFLVPSERTVPAWLETLDLMRGLGAEATPEQWGIITEYLIVNLAYLSVNKATADEIRMIFAVPEKVAQGVVAYRDTQGGFKTIDDLKKAPELDAAKVDALQPRLIFESVGTAPAGAAPQGVQAAAVGLPDAPGKALVEQVCATCHGTDYLVPSTRTVAQWRDTLAVMKTSGAKASDEEWKTLTTYFMANVAYLNLNKATAEDIQLVFDVPDKIARAIVARRDAQGGFKTIDDVKQVPDVDPKRVDALKERLTY